MKKYFYEKGLLTINRSLTKQDLFLSKLFLLLSSLFLFSSVSGQTVWSGTSANAVGLQPVVNQFRNNLGTLNANVASSFTSGRREINWDGVPDNFSAPNNMPPNFFNVNSPRGAVFSTPGTGFQVSANAVNPTGTPVEFGNLSASYPNLFATFSPQRLFTSQGSTITDVSFFLPGSNTPAFVRGFGAVFSDVDLANTTKIQYFDQNGNSLGIFNVPNLAGNQTFSFLGVSFATPIIAKVRITSGNSFPGPGRLETPALDVVVMDDFIYSEPAAATTQVAFSGTSINAAGLQPVVNQFRTRLGNLNANVAGSFTSGRREINWDGVPDNFSAPNNMPPNFFNVNSPRGAVFSTPGTGFQVSANAVNPTGTPVEFGNLSASYPNLFATFSPQRLFTSQGSTVTDVTFFLPGSNTLALVKGFGAVFTDVDLANTTKIQYFDKFNNSLGIFNVPNLAGNQTFSFLGVSFATPIIAKVRITSGNFYPGPGRLETPALDVVVMDDFIYSEPAATSSLVAFSSSSVNAAGLQPVVNQFRTRLGNLNANVAGSFTSGRREINWDGVPDNFSAPNNMPPNFFNVNSPRGAVFSTPGTGFQVSANAVNPTGTPVEFGNLSASYPNLFATFSPQRLFTARGSTVTDVSFFLPGSNTPALVKGFGAVFTDVDLANTTKIQYFDKFNNSLGIFNVPNLAGNQTFSFLGVSFATPIIAKVRITSGNFYPGPGRLETPALDVVVMDDFIYSEPAAISTQVAFSGTSINAVGLQPVVNQFRNNLGTLNANVAGSFTSGRREINWDGVPDNFSAPNNMPPNFFNVNSPRGAVFSTPGTGFQVSANAVNPTGTPVEFGNLSASYPNLFATFSPQRLFTSQGSTVTDVSFFLPGSDITALVRGFGAVFSDVDLANTTKIQYFDQNGNSLGIFNVPNLAGNQTFSFLGVSFATPIIAKVRITSGNFYPGPGRLETPALDVVVMDDFIYSEPFVDPAYRLRVANQIAAITDSIALQNKVEEKKDEVRQFSTRTFPNPSAKNFNISLESVSTDLVELQIRDIYGNLIEHKINVQPNQIITIGDQYRPGIYIVDVVQGSSKKQLRLMKH
ncbi:T9SS type A sorting domain-containing protein [Rhodocytophaga rosea]|uniref:T9SS type A sorting domain-containing protein n=1 Tax=Rhodocytophaga rosea TaxID=2704465 RepID=A0A6C0GEQ1_9BACT|nr:T9SS type A sorting domain-containing protein [Rhodocytophaga rosea]QHT66428.1 T9SS type A sorting domain-containing protein [Rhodocytophaga rosea]